MAPTSLGDVQRDERTIAVEHAGFRLAYLCLSYGLLAAVAYRSVVRDEQPWDLLALVVAGGVVTAGYQAFHRTLGRRWAVITGVTILAAALLAAVAAGLMR
ncbi:MAG: hypothetical protein IT332_09910 [Ardenticatenales bacterium]|nr:hypothetical protein [Ardenticatenales bacterium]